MEIKTFVSPILNANMYIIFEDSQAIVIDPFHSDEFPDWLKKEGITAINYIFLTHEHYDHINGVQIMKERFACPVVSSRICDELIRLQKPNSINHFMALCKLQQIGIEELEIQINPYTDGADILVESKKTIKWLDHILFLSEMPGHSKGSIGILLDSKYLFCGDILLKDGHTITRFPGGSIEQLREITLPLLQSLPNGILVFPGHGDKFLLNEHIYMQNPDILEKMA